MNLDEIKEIIAAITEQDITEFELERGDEKIRIRRGSPSGNHSPQPPYVVVTSATPVGGVSPAAVTAGENSAAAAQRPPAEEGSESGEEAQSADAQDELIMVTAPIVGTFYEASSPGAAPFVQVGDKVEPGQVLCIIEAMKLMNEIEAETAGVIVKRFVQNAQPVEYGEALFAIKAAG